ncbi:hypothetical protein H0H92_013582, partial [Tricholoma furcatifolium]
MCVYTVVIPRLPQPLVTQTPEMFAEELGHLRPDSDEAATLIESAEADRDHLSLPFLSPSEEEVATLLAAMQEPFSTPPSSPSPGVPHPLSSLQFIAGSTTTAAEQLNINLCVPTTFYMPTRVGSHRPHARMTLANEGNQPYFEESVARARLSPDFVLMGHVYMNHNFGMYKVNPEQHPANAKITHHLLQPYDEDIFPGCQNRTLQHLNFMHTNVGVTLREFNSSL